MNPSLKTCQCVVLTLSIKIQREKITIWNQQYCLSGKYNKIWWYKLKSLTRTFGWFGCTPLQLLYCKFHWQYFIYNLFTNKNTNYSLKWNSQQYVKETRNYLMQNLKLYKLLLWNIILRCNRWSTWWHWCWDICRWLASQILRW